MLRSLSTDTQSIEYGVEGTSEAGAAAVGEWLRLWASRASSIVRWAYHLGAAMPQLQREQGWEWVALTHIAEGLVAW